MPDAAATFLAIGSRGDVEPMAILAGELVSRGAPVTVIAVDEYADLVRSYGAEFRGVGPGMSAMARLSRGWLGELALRTPLAQPLLLRRWLAGLSARLAELALDSVPLGSLVVTGLASRDAGVALAEARGCRLATVLHTAILPTAERDSHLEGRQFLGWRRRDHGFAQWYWETTSGLSRAASSGLRQRLGLPDPGSRGATAEADRHPILLAADPVLVPTAADWPSTCRQTGAIVPGTPRAWRPPEQLAAFLAEGTPPLYVGLGSINDLGGRRWLELIEEASRLSGQRIVTPVLNGEEPAVLDGRVCTVLPGPHAWLFERVAGVIHHGGAGTTASALRAGVPSVAVPALFDQHYHARRLVSLGVGPSSVPLHRLTAARLARLVVALSGGGYRARAADVGERVRASDGLTATMAALEPLL